MLSNITFLSFFDSSLITRNSIAIARICHANSVCLEQLLEERDDEMFDKIKYNPNHTLHQLLPAQSMAFQLYDLRDRTHDRQLPAHQGHLLDCNFITRMLYKDIY